MRLSSSSSPTTTGFTAQTEEGELYISAALL